MLRSEIKCSNNKTWNNNDGRPVICEISSSTVPWCEAFAFEGVWRSCSQLESASIWPRCYKVIEAQILICCTDHVFCPTPSIKTCNIQQKPLQENFVRTSKLTVHPPLMYALTFLKGHYTYIFLLSLFSLCGSRYWFHMYISIYFMFIVIS